MLSALLFTVALLSAEPDTLQTAVISVQRGISVSRADTLKLNDARTVTDLLLQSPGLLMSDLGGLAGSKKVNLRGLGSPHTTIYIDGIKVSEVQSGQPDLGMLGLENFSGVVIDYAQNSLNFSTERPVFREKNIAGRLDFSAGSFGTYLPAARLDFRLSDRVSLSANAAGTISRGDFPYGSAGLARQNNDIRQIRGGVDVFGAMEDGEWMAKAYYSGADRGTPGSVDWPSTDRQQDRNAFLQGRLSKNFSAKYRLDVSAKAARDDIHYTSQWADSDYAQTDVQLNTAQRFRASNWLNISAVAELQRDVLKATDYDAARTGLNFIAGAEFSLPRFRADLTLEYAGTFDRSEEKPAAGIAAPKSAARHVISPSADFRLTLAPGLCLLGFARRAYRTPTFNELYYPGYGNPDLRPEDAWLTDIGVDWLAPMGSGWTVKAKVDGFYNVLRDKITSAPSAMNPSIWLPYNIGEVRAVGVDAAAGVGLARGEWKARLEARYSFQDADNVPYLSRHTAVLSADASFRGWGLNAVWNFRGGRRDSYGEMPDWNTLDLVLSKEIFMGNSGPLTLHVSCRNVTDCRYELVTGYPMQGRSILAGLTFLL